MEKNENSRQNQEKVTSPLQFGAYLLKIKAKQHFSLRY
jgi:hypothetical protein